MLERQEVFHKTLTVIYEKEGHDYWVDKKVLVRLLNNILGREEYKLNLSPTSHDPCVALNSDMYEINASDNFEKFILLKNNHFKIATREELLEEYEKRKTKLIREATKMGIINKKLKTHGQGQVFDVNEFKENYFE